MRDLSNWEVVDVTRDEMTFWNTISSDAGQRLTFVCKGADLERDYDEDGYTGVIGIFKSFTIDGREPTTEEEDTYSDDIRELIRIVYSDI